MRVKHTRMRKSGDVGRLRIATLRFTLGFILYVKSPRCKCFHHCMSRSVLREERVCVRWCTLRWTEFGLGWLQKCARTMAYPNTLPTRTALPRFHPKARPRLPGGKSTRATRVGITIARIRLPLVMEIPAENLTDLAWLLCRW